MSDLSRKSCQSCHAGTGEIAPEKVGQLMKQVPEWTLAESGRSIARTFRFNDFHETMAFVNAVAYIAHRQDHHPDLQVTYKECSVQYKTHAIGGLSENDFICAAKIDALLL